MLIFLLLISKGFCIQAHGKTLRHIFCSDKCHEKVQIPLARCFSVVVFSQFNKVLSSYGKIIKVQRRSFVGSEGQYVTRE